MTSQFMKICKFHETNSNRNVSDRNNSGQFDPIGKPVVSNRNYFHSDWNGMVFANISIDIQGLKLPALNNDSSCIILI